MVKEKEGDFQRFLFFHSFLLCLCKPLASDLFALQAMQLGKPRVVSSWLHRDDSLLVTAPEYPAQGLKKNQRSYFYKRPFLSFTVQWHYETVYFETGMTETTVARRNSDPKPLFACLFSSVLVLSTSEPSSTWQHLPVWQKTFLDSQDDKVRKYKAFVS